MSTRKKLEEVKAQVELLGEMYSSDFSTLEIREELGLSEGQLADRFFQAQQAGLLTFDPDHVRGARFGTSLRKELAFLLGVEKDEDPILLLRKTREGVFISLRSSSVTSTETAHA